MSHTFTASLLKQRENDKERRLIVFEAFFAREMFPRICLEKALDKRKVKFSYHLNDYKLSCFNFIVMKISERHKINDIDRFCKQMTIVKILKGILQ